MTERIIPTHTLGIVCASLLGLTALTVGASFLDLGSFRTPVAPGFPAAKATLILLYFVHLRYGSGPTRIVMLTSLVCLAVLMFGTLDDVPTRGWLNVPGH